MLCGSSESRSKRLAAPLRRAGTNNDYAPLAAVEENIQAVVAEARGTLAGCACQTASATSTTRCWADQCPMSGH
jgi:hypothetical protein